MLLRVVAKGLSVGPDKVAFVVERGLYFKPRWSLHLLEQHPLEQLNSDVLWVHIVFGAVFN
jgi:hypothetical protein